MTLKNWFNCKVMGSHDWTCKAKEGIPPTPKQVFSGITSNDGFKDYAKMYCKHCGKESKLNSRL